MSILEKLAKATDEMDANFIALKKRAEAITSNLRFASVFAKPLESEAETVKGLLKGFVSEFTPALTLVNDIKADRTRFAAVPVEDLDGFAERISSDLQACREAYSEIELHLSLLIKKAEEDAFESDPNYKNINDDIKDARFDQEERMRELDEQLEDLYDPLQQIKAGVNNFNDGLTKEAECLNSLEEELADAKEKAVKNTEEIKKVGKMLGKHKDCIYMAVAILELIVMIIIFSC